jgi:hypothetical protein
MKQGEKSLFRVLPEYGYGAAGSPPKIPPNATLFFEIELIDIVLSDGEAVSRAERLCTEAADLFKAGAFAKANALYRQAVPLIEEKHTDAADQMKVRLNRNISITYAKLEKWQRSLVYADKVLATERTDLRALLRKCEAHLKLGEAEPARKALDRGLAITHNGAPFLALKPLVEALEREERQHQNEFFKKLLKKD